jgi:hypothetical protein
MKNDILRKSGYGEIRITVNKNIYAEYTIKKNKIEI